MVASPTTVGRGAAVTRVAITGMGVTTPLGNDVPTMWDGLVAGRSGIAPIETFDASALKTRFAGMVRD